MTDLSVQKNESFVEDKIKKHCPDFVEVKARYLCHMETPVLNTEYYELIVESKKEGPQKYIVEASLGEETKPDALSLFKGVKSYNVSKVLETSSKPEREDQPFVEDKIRIEYSHSICCPKATSVKAHHIGTLREGALIYRYYIVIVDSERREQELLVKTGDNTWRAHIQSKKEIPDPSLSKQTTQIDVFLHLVTTVQRKRASKPHSMTIYKSVIFIPL